MFYMIELRWSPSDRFTVLVKASSEEAALDRVNNYNARYKEIIGSATEIIE